MRNGHHKKNSSIIGENKHSKKLSLVSSQVSRHSEPHNQTSKKETIEKRPSIKTPKFGPFMNLDTEKPKESQILLSRSLFNDPEVKQRNSQ